MKFSTAITTLLLLTACPKKETKTIEDVEREAALQELMSLPEDELDDLPEAGEENSDQKPSSSR